MKPPYIVELSGSHTASCPELGVSVTCIQHGVEDALAREMIAAGADPERLMRVERNGTLVFKMTKTVQDWADELLLEHDGVGFEKRRLVPVKAIKQTAY